MIDPHKETTLYVGVYCEPKAKLITIDVLIATFTSIITYFFYIMEHYWDVCIFMPLCAFCLALRATVFAAHRGRGRGFASRPQRRLVHVSAGR